MATQSPPTSRLLALPKELRLLIYEALYPADFPSIHNIDLFSAEPPPKALLLTCKQIHHESATLYTASFRNYWSSSSFILNPGPAPRDAILSLPMREMQHINHIRLHAPGVDFTAFLVHPNGGWGLISSEEERSFRRYRRWLCRPHSKAESVVVPTKAAWDGHANEEDLGQTCEKIWGSVPMVNQVLDLLELELVDLEVMWQKW